MTAPILGIARQESFTHNVGAVLEAQWMPLGKTEGTFMAALRLHTDGPPQLLGIRSVRIDLGAIDLRSSHDDVAPWFQVGFGW